MSSLMRSESLAGQLLTDLCVSFKWEGASAGNHSGVMLRQVGDRQRRASKGYAVW